ncbi:MAG: OmpH family outer membrane protein [Verrucomicrobiota bacterium]
MNRNRLKYWISLFVVAAFCASVQAQTKVGIVDMKKVFDGYWKTQLADANLKDMANEAQKRLKDMVEDGRKLQEEYKKLLESSNDQAVSVEEREKRKKSAEGKLIEMRELENQVQQYDRSARARIMDKESLDREKIVKEIVDAVNAKAKAGGYNLVVDIAAESVNRTPIVLYNDGSNDLTQEVLSHINVNAPADLPKAKDDKKGK